VSEIAEENQSKQYRKDFRLIKQWADYHTIDSEDLVGAFERMAIFFKDEQ
jgi:hypothetical protein